MKSESPRVAVLISGRGSNLKALVDGVNSGCLDMQIVRVVSNRNDATGIQHAKAASIPFSLIVQQDYPDREAHDAAIKKILTRDRVHLVVLAGYMRILGENFCTAFAGRMINLHPSLLPLYRGLDTYDRALQAGDRETGASIHFVTAGLDDGPVISQVRIPIDPGDDAKSLSQRLGPLENRLVVATMTLFCRFALKCVPGAVVYNEHIL